jgi:hypothetical protein
VHFTSVYIGKELAEDGASAKSPSGNTGDELDSNESGSTAEPAHNMKSFLRSLFFTSPSYSPLGKAASNQSSCMNRLSNSVVVTLLKQKSVVLAVVLYTLLAFVYIVHNEVFSLWVIVPVDKGGLGFHTGQIGLLLGIGGGVLIVFQTFIYPFAVRKIGVVRAFQIGTFGGTFIFFLYPLTSNFADTGDNINWILWTSLILVIAVKTCCGGFSFSSIFVLVSNCAPGSQAGAANGLNQSSAALARAVGPAIGGALFAWSNENGLPFPLDYHLVFNMLSLISFVIFLCSLLLSKDSAVRK